MITLYDEMRESLGKVENEVDGRQGAGGGGGGGGGGGVKPGRRGKNIHKLCAWGILGASQGVMYTRRSSVEQVKVT